MCMRSGSWVASQTREEKQKLKKARSQWPWGERSSSPSPSPRSTRSSTSTRPSMKARNHLRFSLSHVNLVYKSQANRSGWFWKGLPGGEEERRDPVCCQVPEDQRQADTETGRDPWNVFWKGASWMFAVSRYLDWVPPPPDWTKYLIPWKSKPSVLQVQHEAEILFSLMEGKRVVTMFDYYEKREHSLLVLEYLQVVMAKEE